MTDTAASPRLAMTSIGKVLGRLQELQASLPPGQAAVVDAVLRSARVAETCPPQYNPFLPGVYTDPYPHYRQLLAANPVHYSETLQVWVLTRYADVLAALRDPRLSSRGDYEGLLAMVPEAERAGVRTVAKFLTATLSQTDPPEHTPLRRVFARALSGAAVARRRDWIAARADALLARVLRDGRMDIVADLAVPLPLEIGAEVLRIPEADRPTVLSWVTDVMHTFSDGFTGAESMSRGERAVPALAGYLRPIVATRRAAPGDDAISAMLADDALEDDIVVSLAMQLLMGIHEPISHTISIGVLALLRAGALADRLRADPALIPGAVEELMRYDGIAPFVTRTAREDMEVDGHIIRAGEKVLLMLPAANRDPARFHDPDTPDLDRRPNPHLAFGAGIHVCPGAALARTTTVAAITALLTRLPDLRLADEPLVWREESNIRGLARLPVVFTPVARSDA